MSKQHINLTIDKDVLETINENRGLIPLSAYINNILKEAVING